MARPIDPRLSIELAGIPLRSPVILAAGTAGYSDELADVMDLSQVGARAIVVIVGETVWLALFALAVLVAF